MNKGDMVTTSIELRIIRGLYFVDLPAGSVGVVTCVIARDLVEVEFKGERLNVWASELEQVSDDDIEQVQAQGMTPPSTAFAPIS